MARLPEVIGVLAQHESRGAATIENYARILRDAGFIRKGKRGIGAPHFSPADGANLVLALAGTTEAANAPEVVPALRGAKLQSKARIGGEMADAWETVRKFSLPETVDTLGGMIEALIAAVPYNVETSIGVTNMSVDISEVTDEVVSATVWLDDGDTAFTLSYFSVGEVLPTITNGKADVSEEAKALLGARAARGMHRSTAFDLSFFFDLSICITGRHVEGGEEKVVMPWQDAPRRKSK